MSRSTKDRDSGSDRTKVRVFYAEVDGSNQSVQEMMRALTTAMGRSPQIMGPQRVLRAPNAPATDARENETAESGDGDPSSDNEADVTLAEPSSASARRRRGQGAIRDRNAGLSIVKSLDLQPSGKKSLKEFVAEKKPQTQEEHIAVYIFYLKSILEEANVGFSHLYTCFKESGERMPVDLVQTCRNAASKKGWIDTSDAEDLKRTKRGDNHVDKELPRVVANGQDGSK